MSNNASYSSPNNASNENKGNNGNNNNNDHGDGREESNAIATATTCSTSSTVNCTNNMSQDLLNMNDRRNQLPAPMISRENISLWSILKNCIGKDMTRIAMPIHFNEPLSFLQRIVEYTEYLNLVVTACETDDPIQRLELVTAFAVSSLSANANRVNKPFNPLLGETFEYHRVDVNNFKMVCEQVSHHPPVSAYHGENDDFILSGSVQPKLKFWGKSIEVKAEGYSNLTLKKFNETYTWRSPVCCVHNIIVGKLWYEQYGEVEVVNHTSKLKSVLNFKSAGWFGKDLDRLDGFIYNKGEKIKFLYGKWPNYLMSACISDYNEYLKEHPQFKVPDKPSDNSVKPLNTPKKSSSSKVTNSPSKQSTKATTSTTTTATISTKSNTSHGDEATAVQTSDKCINDDNSDSPDASTECVPECEGLGTGEIPKSDSTQSLDIPNSRLLWLADERPEDSSIFYGFTNLAMQLNYLDDEVARFIAPTDSRFRPDIRTLEKGKIDQAASEKNRLEEKQRDVRKKKSKNYQHKPLWYRPGINSNTKEEDWFFNHKYWLRDYTECPDIF